MNFYVHRECFLPTRHGEVQAGSGTILISAPMFSLCKNQTGVTQEFTREGNTAECSSQGGHTVATLICDLRFAVPLGQWLRGSCAQLPEAPDLQTAIFFVVLPA